MIKQTKFLFIAAAMVLPQLLLAQQAALFGSAPSAPTQEQSEPAPAAQENIQTPAQTVPFETATISIAAKPAEAAFGRRFDVDFVLPVQAQLLKTAFNNKDFEIVEITPNQLNPLKMRVGIMAFNLGSLEFPQTTWQTKDGKQYFSAPFRIKINKTQTKIKAQGLVDIRPPFKPFNPWIFLFGLAMFALAYAIFYFYKIKKKPVVIANTPYAADTRPLHIIALEQLHNLLLEGLWEDKHYKLFYIRLTNILRDYITARFNIDAHSLTTRDLLRALKNIHEVSDKAPALEKVFKEADYVKFAKILPTAQERDGHIETAKQFINDTKQVEEKEEGVLKTVIQLPKQQAEPIKEEPKIQIIKSSPSPLEQINAEPVAQTIAVAAPAPLPQPAQQTQQQSKEIFLVTAQAHKPIDLKVEHALEQQGVKYGQMLELCFNTCLVGQNRTAAQDETKPHDEADKPKNSLP